MVSKGDVIQIEKIEGEKDAVVKFDKVLFTSDGKSHTVGKPYIEGSNVEGRIIKQARSRKIVILKYKPKSKYRKKQGHRQDYTEVEIITA